MLSWQLCGRWKTVQAENKPDDKLAGVPSSPFVTINVLVPLLIIASLSEKKCLLA